MENCLIKNLKADVNDDALLEFGEMEIMFYAPNKGNTHHQRFHTRGVSHLEIIGEAYFTDSTGAENYGRTKDIDITNEQIMYPSSNKERGTIHYVTGPSSIIRMKSKYNIELITGNGEGLDTNRMSFYPKDLYDFKYCEQFKIIELSNFYNHVSYVRQNYPSLKGDINSLSNLISLKKLMINGYINVAENINMPFEDVVGDIACLSKLTSLIELSFNATNISGTLENLLNGLHTNGKTSGTLRIDLRFTQATYNNSSITNRLDVTFTNEGWSVAYI